MSAEHYACAEDAAEGARAFLTSQYAPFGLAPKVYQIEACGLKAVCLPWSHTKRGMAFKALPQGIHNMAAGLRIIEARVVDTIWWIEGQQEDGRLGALKHVRALADLGGVYGDIFLKINEICDKEDEAAAPK